MSSLFLMMRGWGALLAIVQVADAASAAWMASPTHIHRPAALMRGSLHPRPAPLLRPACRRVGITPAAMDGVGAGKESVRHVLESIYGGESQFWKYRNLAIEQVRVPCAACVVDSRTG